MSLILGVIILIAGCGSTEKSVVLRFKYLPGTSYEYDQNAVRRWKVTEGDSTLQEITSNVSVKVLQLVRRTLEDSTAEVIESSTWDVIAPSKEDKSKIDTLHDRREMIIYMSNRGKAVDLEFVTPLDSAEKQYLREYYEQGFMVFPVEAIHKGSSWTQTAEVVLPETTATAATTFTILDFGVEQGYEVTRIGYDGNLLIPVHENPEDSLKRSGIDRIKITGTLNFAHNEGMVINMNERWQVDGDRKKLRDGKWASFKVLGDMDANYELVSPAKE